MAGRRLSDHEFLAVLAERAPPRGWDLDREGRFLLLPLAERDLAWMLESCREDAEGEYHVFPDGEAVLFARERDLAFARYLTFYRAAPLPGRRNSGMVSGSSSRK